jgi:tryptophan-rich sensory protein
MLFDRSAEPGQHRPLMAFIIATLVVGAAGSFFTEPSIPTWYAGLAKPDFNPPNWIFAPVWTALYVMMAVAAWRVWRIVSPARGAHDGRERHEGIKAPEMWAWMIQLTLNFFWSVIFFSLHQIFFALVEMAALWLAIVVTAVLFWRRDRIAGLLLLPYIAWVSFAFCLNWAIWQLNGG